MMMILLQWRAGQLPGQTSKHVSRCSGTSLPTLQWRAGQLPGQTLLGSQVPLRGVAEPGFNGGPGNCPAKRPRRALPPRAQGSSFNGGPGNCPAKRKSHPRFDFDRGHDSLQWRAGQLPGQTKPTDVLVRRTAPPEQASMEGRAIARPNRRERRPVRAPWTVELASMEGRAIARPNRRSLMAGRGARPQRFNGGPGNCPAKRVNHGHGAVIWGSAMASMEGRAIARPKLVRVSTSIRRRTSFNGGPGNCPAKPGAPCTPFYRCYVDSLQWRAGQLPGQTGVRGRSDIVVVADPPASMEGRAIARPNDQSTPWEPQVPDASMEGRAIARPNRGERHRRSLADADASMEGRAIARPNPSASPLRLRRPKRLQWRAGQLPGQTTSTPRQRDPPRASASMEGRAIARPNDGLAVEDDAGKLQWRAGQLPGQTTCNASRETTPSSRRFNGGPGNCPAKPGPRISAARARSGAVRASMEGRAIARPNAMLQHAPMSARVRRFNGGPGNCPAKPDT